MTGGVCAVLDYELDQMSEYVAEMSMRLTLQTSYVPDPYCVFISQILTATRLPRATILLSLNFLAKRINTMQAYGQGQANITEGLVWRLTTVALILGSKFLDDNTFQNRSWADVSGIPVREINNLELEWIQAINWCLYVNLDRSEDYQAWFKSWDEWKVAKARQQVQAADRVVVTSVPAEALKAATRAAATPAATPLVPAPAPAIGVDYYHQYRSTAYAGLAYSAWCQQQVNEYEQYERLSLMKRDEQRRQQQQQHQQRQLRQLQKLRQHRQPYEPQYEQEYQQPYQPQYQHAAYEPLWSYHQTSHSWPSQPQVITPQAITPPDSGYGTPEYMDLEETVTTTECMESKEGEEVDASVVSTKCKKMDECMFSPGWAKPAHCVTPTERKVATSVSTATADSNRLACYYKQPSRCAVGSGGYSQCGDNDQTYFQARNAATKRPGYNVYEHENIWRQPAGHGHRVSFFSETRPYGQLVVG